MRRLRTSLPTLLCALATFAFVSRPEYAVAQGTLYGQVRIIDKAGADPANLRDVIVWLENTAPMARPAALDQATVGMRLREFEPHVAIVAVGGSVSYPNQDPFSHNVFSNTALGAFDLGLYRTGQSRAAKFPRAGVYAVYCNIHARMVNYVVAVPTPFVVRAAASGAFTIARVPAGAWRLHVWHERAPEHVEPITVTADGLAPLTIALDGRGFVAKPHLNKLGQAYATSRADRY